MALAFADNTTQRVNYGTGPTSGAVGGGIVCIFKPNSIAAAFRMITHRSDAAPAGPGLYRPAVGDGAVRVDIPRATSGIQIYAAAGTIDLTWQMIAVRWVFSGGNADQQMFRGSYPSGAFSEVTYGSQLVGSGAQVTDAYSTCLGAPLRASFNATDMVCAFLAWFDTYPSYDELRAIFRERAALRTMRRQPALWTYPGENGTSSQRDYSNHGYHGTVTGATWAPTPPIAGPLAPRRRAYAWITRARPLVNAGLVERGLVNAGLVN